MRARRFLIAFLTCLLVPAATSQDGAQPAQQEAVGEAFAALVITSHGRQVFDITTGLTTLPDGGRIYDARTKVEVEASVIKYVEGQYIDASGVVVSGEFGHFQAQKMHVDLVGSVLSASGELWLSRDGLTLTAGSLEYYANENVKVFNGGVEGTEPDFYADRLLLDTLTGDVLLDGRYMYAGAVFTMRSPEAGGRLHLKPQQAGEDYVYAAATEVSPTLLQRFSAYL